MLRSCARDGSASRRAYVHLSRYAQLGCALSVRKDSIGEMTFFASTNPGTWALLAVLPDGEGS